MRIETKNEEIHQLHSMCIPFAAWPALRVLPASLVFMLWSPLTSLPNSDSSAPQLPATGNTDQKNVGVPDSYSKPKMVHATGKSLKNWSRNNCVTG